MALPHGLSRPRASRMQGQTAWPLRASFSRSPARAATPHRVAAPQRWYLLLAAVRTLTSTIFHGSVLFETHELWYVSFDVRVCTGTHCLIDYGGHE